MNNKPVVWVVDDDDDDQLLIAQAFRRIIPPVEVKALADGDELIPSLKLEATPPKLILLDLNMRRKSGFKTLEELRAIPDYEKLPVVVLTTSDAPDDFVRSLALGANGVLTKPPLLDDLRSLAAQLNLDWHLNQDSN